MRPVLFSFGGFELMSAPLLAALSAVLAWLYFERERPRLKMSNEDFWVLMLAAAVGVLAGGVLLFLAVSGRGPMANLRWALRSGRVTGGSFYGSFWGAAFLAWLWCRLRRVPFLPVADVLGPASLLSLSVMRIGCLLHGCCHGKAASWGWGLVFTDPRCRVPRALLGTPIHPTQLYEAAGSLLLFLAVHRWVRPGLIEGRRPPGFAFAMSIFLYAGLRFGLEFLKGTDPGLLAFAGLTSSQWIAAASAAVAAGVLLRPRQA